MATCAKLATCVKTTNVRRLYVILKRNFKKPHAKDDRGFRALWWESRAEAKHWYVQGLMAIKQSQQHPYSDPRFTDLS